MACHHDPPPHDCNEASGLWNETRVLPNTAPTPGVSRQAFCDDVGRYGDTRTHDIDTALAFHDPIFIPSLTQALASQFGQVLIGEPPVWEKEGIA